MKSWKTPTPSQVDRAVAQLGDAAQARYFFDRLENPEWIEPLWERGYFRTPPAPRHEQERGTVVFPQWPEARYLARMVAKKPEMVRDLIWGLPDTHNPAVHDDLVRGILEMPAQISATLTGVVTKWVRDADQVFHWEQLSQLVVHWAKGEQIGAALELARALLSTVAEPSRSVPVGDQEQFELPPEPRGRVDEWAYGEIIREVSPVLAACAGVRAMELFSDLLEEAVRASTRRGAEAKPNDYSWVWRPAIEDHGQNRNHGQDLRNLLVSAVRDTAEQLVESRAEELGSLVERLETRRWRLFRRIALHLLHRFPDRVPTLVTARLTTRELFDEPWARHEYAVLIREQFGNLGAAEQELILKWIEAGPDVDKFRRSSQELWGKSVTEADVDRYREMWQRDRLAPIKDAVPDSWRFIYERLVAKYGEPELHEFASRTTSYVGPTSPKSAEELRAMLLARRVEFLREWRPSESEFTPSPEGLGRTLTDLVKEDAEGVSRAAGLFIGLDATYVRALVRGLEEAISEGKSVDWTRVVALCRWAVGQPDPVPEPAGGGWGRDPHWGWTRKAIASLMSVGFQKNSMPIGLRRDAWEVVEHLTRDPDPVPEEEVNREARPDPATASINTTRGEAMHGVVQYALWVRRQLEKDAAAEVAAARGLDEMPEVRQVFDIHLDPSLERALAIRSVYGQYLPWLWLLDEAWLAANLERIFPSGEEGRAFAEAAWNTYIVFCPPYDKMLEVLRKQYADAVERIEFSAERPDALRNPGARLAEHLMLFYARGWLVGDDALFRRFWEKAPPKIRAHAMAFIGRTLREDGGAVEPAVLSRLQELWSWRLGVAGGDHERDTGEMAAFGWWFTSGKFNETWAVTQLDLAVEIAGKVEHDLRVVQRLAKLASQYPLEAVRVLARLLSGEVPVWRILSWRGGAEQILRSAIGSGREDARREAQALVHRLGRTGYFEFRSVLREASD